MSKSKEVNTKKRFSEKFSEYLKSLVSTFKEVDEKEVSLDEYKDLKEAQKMVSTLEKGESPTLNKLNDNIIDYNEAKRKNITTSSVQSKIVSIENKKDLDRDIV